MLEVRIEVDKESQDCLVYQQEQASALCGQLIIRSSDKLKLRQITIRLRSTEIVDLNEQNGSSLQPMLQKTVRNIFTWVVLEKGPQAHVLLPTEHSYSFEITLPKGLDGSVNTSSYKLNYELEARLEHSFKLKPDTAVLTPVTLVQVPTANNLHSDDRVSMRIETTPDDGQTPETVPLGRALWLKRDMINANEEFVLRHLWVNGVALKLRLPLGRVFGERTSTFVEMEAVPLTRHYKVTKLGLALEELLIIARPQRPGTSRQGAISVQNTSLSPSSTRQSNPSVRRNSSVYAPSIMSSVHSVEDEGGNAQAYAQDSSSDYQDAITKVRSLDSTEHQAWPRPSRHVPLAQFSGIAHTRAQLRMPKTKPDSHTHMDIRNSHIQIHHQISYALTVQRVSGDEDHGQERINALAHMYGTWADSTIVRRDDMPMQELRDRPNVWVLQGTVPVTLVPRRIYDLWRLKTATLADCVSEVSPVNSVPEPTSSPPPMAATSTMRMPTVPSNPTVSPRPSVRSEHTIGNNASLIDMDTDISAIPQPPPQQLPQQPPQHPGGFSMPMPTQQPGNDSFSYPNMAPQPYQMMFQQQMMMFQEQQRQQQQQFFQQLQEQYMQMMPNGNPQASSGSPMGGMPGMFNPYSAMYPPQMMPAAQAPYPPISSATQPMYPPQMTSAAPAPYPPVSSNAETSTASTSAAQAPHPPMISAAGTSTLPPRSSAAQSPNSPTTTPTAAAAQALYPPVSSNVETQASQAASVAEEPNPLAGETVPEVSTLTEVVSTTVEETTEPVVSSVTTQQLQSTASTPSQLSISEAPPSRVTHAAISPPESPEESTTTSSEEETTTSETPATSETARNYDILFSALDTLSVSAPTTEPVVTTVSQPPAPAPAPAPAVTAEETSPPPDYESLLPPEYEIPTGQPPPYTPMSTRRGRRT